MRINWKEIYRGKDIFTKQDALDELDFFIKTLRRIKNAIKDNDLNKVYDIWYDNYEDFIVVDLIEYISSLEN